MREPTARHPASGRRHQRSDRRRDPRRRWRGALCPTRCGTSCIPGRPRCTAQSVLAWAAPSSRTSPRRGPRASTSARCAARAPRPSNSSGCEPRQRPAPAPRWPPRQRRAAPNATAFTHGTSNAAASGHPRGQRVFDILEAGRDGADDFDVPRSSVQPRPGQGAARSHQRMGGRRASGCERLLGLGPQRMRDASSRAVLGLRREYAPSGSRPRPRTGQCLIAGGSSRTRAAAHLRRPAPGFAAGKGRMASHHGDARLLRPDSRPAHPLPRRQGVLRAGSTTVTPGGRGSKPNTTPSVAGVSSTRSSTAEGAIVFKDGASLPIHVQCMDDAQRLRARADIRYGLVVSIETAVSTSTTIHDEVRPSCVLECGPRSAPGSSPSPLPGDDVSLYNQRCSQRFAIRAQRSCAAGRWSIALHRDTQRPHLSIRVELPRLQRPVPRNG